MISLEDVYTIEEDEEATREEEVAALQRFIGAGMWSLQGSYGRAMQAAIDTGECVLGPSPAHDYWGNRIPSRHEVKPGTLGSIGYANKLRKQRGDELLTEAKVRKIEAGR